ncbi:hypothetical protein C7S18_06200 [Ahniella affigens]|uniref:Uncharacterized protein n=1 Tax=Ahniella affigens TaxID=2021234 RepID=A0A2P1PPP4_9GAMM|nr:hypothetical protein [Ahniella affigens]AVP96817.1 hypothetical protein C7S18_06200 [Ahniella affigens]
MNIFRICSLSAVLLLVACAREFEFSLPDDQELQLTEYSNGAVDGQCTVAVGSKAQKALNAWLVSNKTGWDYTYATYAPGTLVEGPNFSINVQEGQVIIVNVGTQYVKPVKAPELSFLSCSAES